MIGVIATCRIKPGMEQQFCETMLRVIAQIRLHEPDTLSYQLTKSRTEPLVYKVLELYRSDAALAAHQATPYFIAAGPSVGAALASPPELDILDVLDVPSVPA